MIKVTPYTAEWTEQFEALASTIREATWADIVIEHVGSTSVPGLAAKPIIDIDIIVSEAEVSTVIESLAKIGYEHRGNLGIEGREAFYAPEDIKIAHHLYVCVEGSTAVRNHLALRDFLRAHPEFAQQYGELKVQLAQEFPNDIDSYVDGKTNFIANILSQCEMSSSEVAAIGAANRLPKSDYPTIIECSNFKLRPHREADKVDLIQAGYDPEMFWKIGSEVPTIPIEDYASLWLELKLDPKFSWAIEVNETCIGSVWLHSIEETNSRARFAIEIHNPKYRSKGLGKEATKEIIKVAFDLLGIHRLDLRVLTSNISAIACYKACGFKEEGIQRETIFINEKWDSDLWMSILEDEYKENISNKTHE